ncbi:MAG: MscL family protein [Planctomycetes bacterium]|nr:MscL family protein [Planctomycetota bacterium]
MPPPPLAREFKDFLFRTNMLALALAVVVGNAVGKVIASIVANVFMPVFAVLTPTGHWREWKVGVGKLRFGLGDLAGSLLDFVLIALVVFFATKFLIRKTPAPPTKTCPQCMEAIHADAKRCKFCTAAL